MQNKLEKILEKASKNLEKYRDEFHSTLRSSEVYVPLTEEQVQMRDGNLSLMLASNEDDELLFVVFTSEANLKLWLTADCQYSVVPIQEIFKIAQADDNRIVINPAGPHAYEMTVEEINFVVSGDKGAYNSEVVAEEPSIDTSELQIKLTKELCEFKSINEAYLYEAIINNQRHLMLGLYFGLNREPDTCKQVMQHVEQLLAKGDFNQLKTIELDSQALELVSDVVEAFYMNY